VKDVDWDSLYDNPIDRERDAVLGYIWTTVKDEKDQGNAVAAFALIRLAHDIEKGKHLGT